MWESRVFCEISKELWKAWRWLSTVPPFPQLVSRNSPSLAGFDLLRVEDQRRQFPQAFVSFFLPISSCFVPVPRWAQ